jgi:hypothetical protein
MPMTTKTWGAALCALAVLLSGCSEKQAPERGSVAGVAADAAGPPAPAAAPKLEGLQRQRAAEAAPDAPDAPVLRLLAVRHELQLVTEADAVESAWRSASEACAAAGCEVLSSQLLRDDEQRPAQAALEARLPPEQLDAFLARVTALGRIGRHTRSAEDKTDEVIDTDARIRNMSTFRDHLRGRMATPNARLKDLIEVERELVRVQSELDSLASRRKALASQTGKVHVQLSITPRPSVLEQGMWSTVRHAVVGSGHLLARSVAAAIELIVVALPWTLLGAAALLGIRGWRRRRARGAVA